jgi:hypothetical protein
LNITDPMLNIWGTVNRRKLEIVLMKHVRHFND